MRLLRIGVFLAFTSGGAQKLAYIDGGDLWVKADLNGRAARLTRTGGYSAPRFSASGKWLSAQRQSVLWVFKPDDGTALRIGSGTGEWAPDTDRLAFTSLAGTWILRPEDRFARTRHLVRFAVAGQIWSPDGSLLAAGSTRVVGRGPAGEPMLDGLLYSLPVDGGLARPLLRKYLTGYIPEGWTADGSLLFFVDPDFSASVAADGLELFFIPSAGGRVTSLGFSALLDLDMVSFSPDRRHLAASAGAGRNSFSDKRILTYDFAAKSRTWLTSAATASISPAWSPDGSWIAYASGRTADVGAKPSPERRIWIIHPNGTGNHPLTREPGWLDEHPVWIQDSSAVLFCRRRLDGTPGGVWLARLQIGAQPVRILERIDLPQDYYGYAAWGRVLDVGGDRF